MSNNGKTCLSIDIIKARAGLLSNLRNFMSQKGVLEVETPYLSKASNPDPNIINLQLNSRSEPKQALYLHSSPEFPMKRLLASGVGSIYQICRVFRDEEIGKNHNTEFTMLEYYQIGFDYHQLMDELNSLLRTLGFQAANKVSYRQAFIKYMNIDPFITKTEILRTRSTLLGLMDELGSRSRYLDFLFSQKIAPNLGIEQPCFIYDYPCEQAALAKVRYDGKIAVAERFELFIHGLEIANGYHELNDTEELRKRFENDIQHCKENNLPFGSLDENLLNTTKELPDCSGVAIGIDRLLMTMLGLEDINQVLCFPSNQA